MSLIPFLLQAIVSVDGEALVMHASERPYVVSPSGQVELASGGFTLDAVSSIVAELLPPEFRQTLEDFGAVQYTLPPQVEFPREQFTLIAARGGEDVWAEIRRRRLSDDDRVPGTFFAPLAAVPPQLSVPAAPSDDAVQGPITIDGPLELPAGATRPDKDARPECPLETTRLPVSEALSTLSILEEPVSFGEPTVSEPAHVAQAPAVVLAMTRGLARSEPGPAVLADDARLGLERLLRTAAARGASALYLASGARPSVRVDGKLQMLDKEPSLTPDSVALLLALLKPGRGHESAGADVTSEWLSDIEGVGRLRCMTFHDHRGPGGVLRLMPRSLSAEQLGLSREIQALAGEPDGLILVAAPRTNGKRTLIGALVDIVNRTRCDHVVTIEREVRVLHTNGSSFVSQREVRGGDEEVLIAAHAALREDPDILVLEEIRTRALMDVALGAAGAGRLVLAGVSAHDAAETVERVCGLYGPDSVRQTRAALAGCLRGVVAQALLPRIGGGRVAARELLLNTPVVADMLAEGNTSQLALAIEGGRRDGMIALSDALLALVQTHAVDLRAAYRHVKDLPAFLSLLERHGIDTSALERGA